MYISRSGDRGCLSLSMLKLTTTSSRDMAGTSANISYSDMRGGDSILTVAPAGADAAVHTCSTTLMAT
eukprot:CAMPEP_0173400320 /NCGR_PEP_ID=MMETSP1356-20130122/47587_1 /TAXON_ID=77927 ORGANISM="Hemiselmis virescens, Strain PCC157" /NCGR_SAMPLE_ID=MMETSP1356 /ASSEMBLY_ACC=CAM_ASM_000847 /LENGTH=67 /DNA_ID=CAMNT_0014360223 /DNA_START=88 /DNA_END=288 /DNA_ORIENTATION=-